MKGGGTSGEPIAPNFGRSGPQGKSAQYQGHIHTPNDTTSHRNCCTNRTPPVERGLQQATGSLPLVGTPSRAASPPVAGGSSCHDHVR